MNAANIQELISGKGFIMVNKGLAKAVGLVPATIYGELVSTFLYWKDRDQLTEQDGKEWFFCTIEDLEDKTTIKKDAQNKAIKVLEKEGLIITKRFGLPAKRYFYITDKYIEVLFENYFSEKPKTDNDGVSSDKNSENPDLIRFRENRKLDFGKTDTNKKELNKKEFSSSSNSRNSRNSIDSDLKEKYPNAPFVEIKEQVLNDDTLVIETDKQYKSMLEYRLMYWKTKTAEGNKPKNKQPKQSVRKEILPEWFDDKEIEQHTLTKDSQKDIEQKKKELQKTLKELKKMDQQEKREL